MRPTGAGDSRALLALLAAALLITGIGVTGGLPSLEEHSSHDADLPTTWNVDIQPDGDARITITMRFRLETENETGGFERLAGEFENGTTTVLSPASFERAASLASRETNRSMTVEAVERSTATENGTGRLTLSFTWTNFARVSGDRLVVGDVFQSPSGTWLPRLTDRQEMIVDFPPQYAPESLSWPLRDGSVFIDGPVNFAPGEPSVTFREVSPNVSVREATLGADRIHVGEPVDVTTIVENTGREAGTKTIELRIDGEAVASREVTVGPESSQTVTFTRTFEEAGTFAIAVDEVAAGTLTVEVPPANLSIRSATLDRERVRPGESATVAVTVANDGGESGTRSLNLSVNGSVVETRTVTVAGGESRTVNFTRTFEEAGTFATAVDEVEAGTLAVEVPPANLSIRSATLDRERVRPGESATVAVTVANDGGESGTRSLNLSVNGSVVETRTVTVAGGESRTVNFTRTFEEAGTFATAVDEVETGTLTVEESTPTTPTTTAPTAPTTTVPMTTTAPPPTTSPGGGAGSDLLPLVGVVSVIALLGAFAYSVRRREGGVAGALSTLGEGDDSEGATADGDTPATPGESTAEGDAPANSAPGGDSTEAENGGGVTDAPLLSDEERVLTLLQERDGRMKQADIVDATDWSNAKVSQLLSEMAEGGEIRKLRIGRENLITLPEEAPDGTD
jgi:uncharacterized membrane protein